MNENKKLWPAGKQVRQIVAVQYNSASNPWFTDEYLNSVRSQLAEQGVAVVPSVSGDRHIETIDVYHDAPSEPEIAYIPDTIYDRDDLLIGEETEPAVSSGEGVEAMSPAQAKELFPGIEIVYDGI